MLMAAAISLFAADVEREMRSAWVATVWRLDWPETTASPGNQTQINKQKQQMVRLIDSLYVNNFNAINLQVRSRADAFYKSSYDPWSSELTGTRGADPGWDPLAFAVEECHKRGMEIHAWLNPYRYESATGQWDGQSGNYRSQHPEWILDVKGAAIFNPALQEVTDLICNIAGEIVTKYDVDGVLFDDYFYLSGTTTEHDGAQYDAYKAAGGTLSVGDWRRDNVNRMIASVYARIKSIKPYVRFGVSPAGIACTSPSVASKYGISPCPTGSDWQYNDIYSDPIAWISSHSLDFISPQIYWTIGNSSADYDKATKWWSQVAKKFDRHLYVSHSISNLTSGMNAPAGPERASGPNADTFSEYHNEVNLNREYSLDGAPGSIFYSAKYIYRNAPLFGHSLKKTVFNTRALVPAMHWMNADTPSQPGEVSIAGSRLSWQAQQSMRYSVYAFPASMSVSQMSRDPKYLLGVTYKGEYTLPSDKLSGYKYGVATYDRYGNESTLTIAGMATKPMTPPSPVNPVAGKTVELPFDFEWTNVPEASEFIVEVARNENMSDRIAQKSCTGNKLSADELGVLPLNTTLYWRVRACGAGYTEGVCAAQPFKVTELRIASPANDETLSTLTPLVTFTIDGRQAILDIADNETFDNIIYSEMKTGNHAVPEYTLSANTHYWLRARHGDFNAPRNTPVVHVITPDVTPSAPAVAFPLAGGILHGDQTIRLTPAPGATSLRLEVSASTSFPSRSSYTNTKVSYQTGEDSRTASEIKLGTKKLEDGNTYYIRARAAFTNAEGKTVNGDYCEPIAFTYSVENEGLDETLADSSFYSLEGRTLTVKCAATLYDAEGRAVAHLTEGANNLEVSPGVYILTASGKNAKIIIR